MAKATAPTPVTESTAQGWSEPKIYVGPSTPLLGVINNTFYTDYPAAFREAAEKAPRIKQLFINILMYPQAERDIAGQTGYIWEAYKAVVELGGEG